MLSVKFFPICRLLRTAFRIIKSANYQIIKLANHQILSSKYITKHKYFTAREDSYETPAGKVIDQYFVVELPESACAFAVTEEGDTVLINQYRHPIGQDSVEIPGGFIDENEEKETGMRRELLEETGYSFPEIYYLGKTYANPGVLNNASHLFLALNGKKTGEQQLDDNEEIDIFLKSLKEVKQMLAEDGFKQSMHENCIRRAFDHPALKNHPALQG